MGALMTESLTGNWCVISLEICWEITWNILGTVPTPDQASLQSEPSTARSQKVPLHRETQDGFRGRGNCL